MFVRLLRWKVMWASHYACPFGAVASVHAWERVGVAICSIARKLLGIPLMRYVDDFFAADRFGGSCMNVMLRGSGQARNHRTCNELLGAINPRHFGRRRHS